EIGGHRDDRPADFGAHGPRRPLLERAEDHRRDFLRAILLIAEADLDVLAHLPLDRLDGLIRGQDPLVAGRIADQAAAGSPRAALPPALRARYDRAASPLRPLPCTPGRTVDRRSP